MSKALILSSVRIIPRDEDFLNRKLGSRGEIFFDQDANTLRLYDGEITGGISLAKSDLSNISNQLFKDKAASAGISASTTVNENPPPQPNPGELWFDTDTGVLYLYYNDGNSAQWVQPSISLIGAGGGGGGGSGGVNPGIQNSLAFYPNSGSTVDDISEVTWSNNRLSVDGSITASGQKSYMRFSWASLSELNNEVNATNWQGMIAHAQQEGRVYFAHNGSWNGLVTQSELNSATSSFSTIAVSGQSNVVADSASDTLTLVAGPNITITTNATNDSITISATSAGGGAGGVSTGAANRLAYYASTGNIIEDSGSNLTWNGTTLGITGQVNATSFVGNGEFLTGVSKTSFSTISVTGQSNVVADSTQDTLTLVAGSGISITTNATNDSVTIGSTVSLPNAFATFSVSGQSNVVADSTQDTLTLVAGQNIVITTDPNTDSITISAEASGFGNAIDDLTDVTITSPQAGQVLKYNGSIWVNDTDSTAAGTSNLNDLGDVVIASPQINHVLKYNGSSWVNLPEDTVTFNAFTTITVSGQTNVVADSATDTLTLVAGDGISITTNNSTDTITITNTVTQPSDFASLSDASQATLTVDKIYLPAITMLMVTNSGASAYLFDQYPTNNPTVYAISGTTIAFNLNVAGHPFLIQDGTGTNYDTGLVHVATNGVVTTGSAAQGKTSGTLYWKIPVGLTGGYRYQCSVHGAMVGSITIKGFPTL